MRWSAPVADRRPPGPRSSARGLGGGAVAALDHHARRLHARVHVVALDEPELLDRVARDRRGDAVGAGLDLDQRHDAGDLDRDDASGESVARGQPAAPAVALGILAQPLDLLERYEAAVARVAARLDAAEAIPATQRVDADADRLRSLAQRHVLHRAPIVESTSGYTVAAMRLSDAAHQAWPPFVLVTGLLLVGVAANADGLFARAGRLLERVPGPPPALLAASMALVTAVTAVLNLDTAVVFLTPVLVHAARARGADEEPFLFSAVFMANASSLYLPGSNLTNLLVLARDPISGATFAGQMIAPALAATLVTATGLLVMFATPLRAANAAARAAPVRDGPAARTVGAAATIAAAGLTVALRNPALPVLAVGAAATATQIARRRLSSATVIDAVGPLALAGLFCLSVGLGVLARTWSGPSHLLAHAGRVGTTAIGALAAVAVNNLPAAVLLSARAPVHPRALLIGLNLGPNLAVTGSLSAYLWFRAARQVDARPNAVAYTRRGLVLAPLAIAGALAAAALLTSVS